ncbi:hypothetical protein, partial [Escherichia coli]|uniref:hypothetical protein n=1 Tax=Escherichia coli TaxID=562 RepID=UPI0019551897
LKLLKPLKMFLSGLSVLAGCFLVFLRVMGHNATEGVLRGAYNGIYGKWIGFSGRFDRIFRWV